jgi:hypothetical protein
MNQRIPGTFSGSKAVHPMSILSRVWCGDYIRRVGFTTGFIGSHAITVYALLQLTTVHYNTRRVVTSCLSSNTAGSVRLQLWNSLHSTARAHTRRPTDWLGSHSKTDCTAAAPLAYIAAESVLLGHDITRHVMFVAPAAARAFAMLFIASVILFTSHLLLTVDWLLWQPL